MRCEGYRRYGGAFALGPVTWRQCENEAVLVLTVMQEDEASFPACAICVNEAIQARGITVLGADELPKENSGGQDNS